MVGRVRGRGVEGVGWEVMVGMGMPGGRVVRRLPLVGDLGGRVLGWVVSGGDFDGDGEGGWRRWGGEVETVRGGRWRVVEGARWWAPGRYM